MNNKGQVALIVLLISAVVMTMGLSMAKKTVVDLRVESDQEQLKQAFNAAESGVEYYLGTGTTKYLSTDNVSRADVYVRDVGVGATVNFNQITLVDNNVGYWLVGHDANGDIDYTNYYGGNSLGFCIDSAFGGAMEISYFYLESGTYKVQRFGYNYDADYVSGFTNVSPLPAVGGRCIANYREQVVPANLGGGIKPLLLNIKLMKNSANLYLLGSGQAFPSQGIAIDSTGRVGDVTTSVSGVNRKLNVVRLYQLPSFVLDAITTYGNVLSN